MTYGLLSHSKPVAAANAVTFVLSISILVLKLRFDRDAMKEVKRRMSHEGIRIVNADDARREAEAEKALHADAVTPKKVRVMKTEGTGVEIDWKDGHHSAWNFAWLRNACPCATCHEEREKTGRKPGVAEAQGADTADDV